MLVQINEWFILIFIMITHNRNAKDLGKEDDDEDYYEEEEV